MCAECQDVDDIDIPCDQCGQRSHVFWEDPVGKFIDYLRESRKFADNIYVISHNSRGYDAQFLLKRFLELGWRPDLIMDGTKILSMKVEHLVFIYSLNYINMALKSIPKLFDVTCKKGFYPHFYNTHANLDYVGLYPDAEYYGADYMSEGERTQFLAWHGEQKDEIFNNREQLLAYCMDDVKILRQACCIFRNLFLDLEKWTPFGKLSPSHPFAIRCSGPSS
jgi:hypothetical protein